MGLKGQQSGLDSQHQEFNIQQEDFPALPRPQSVHNKSMHFIEQPILYNPTSCHIWGVLGVLYRKNA